MVEKIFCDPQNFDGLAPTNELQEMYLWIGQYGNTGCGVFKQGGTKLERFLPKNQHAQRKFLNFENWTNGEPK